MDKPPRISWRTLVTGKASILLPRSYLIKVTLVTCEKSFVKFDSTKHRRFSPGTPVSSCSNTGPTMGGLSPYWTSRVPSTNKDTYHTNNSKMNRTNNVNPLLPD